METPRAALRAADLAEHADFFSLGTNDLSQLTFGFSRDDVEGRIMARYLEEGLLTANPFETVDATGVGELVRLAVERGRAARPDLEVGVCGEHGGDPARREGHRRPPVVLARGARAAPFGVDDVVLPQVTPDGQGVHVPTQHALQQRLREGRRRGHR